MVQGFKHSLAAALLLLALVGCSQIAPQSRPLSDQTLNSLISEKAQLEEQRRIEEERRRQAYSSEEVEDLTSADTMNSNWVKLNNKIDTIDDEIRYRKRQQRVLEFLDETDRARGGQM
ncbi:hypothetical protein [Desulfovibrio inopinatus]|uniref:hypothetical protein n=1 Tax=Desulfovibrio inopinatus TaxID=102109 RepID=UPI0004896133|nr:hypothetical protein [Desulfovibrio inopinatus]